MSAAFQQDELKIPLLERKPDDIICWDVDKKITCQQFIDDVIDVASRLPDIKYAVNFCSNRYLFMVSFAAVLYRGQTNLLPPSQAIDEVNAIADDYKDTYFIVNETIDDLKKEALVLGQLPERNMAHHEVPLIPCSHTAAIVFTSGSSGKPAAHEKQWGNIISCAKRSRDRFDITQQRCLIATVPSQHMYGLETSVLYPLIAPVSVYNGQPFYPEDIRKAAESAHTPVLLITTPVHLRACIKASLQWQNIDFVISAAATLPVELARAVTEAMHTVVYEIYGCTEAGSMASRQTLQHNDWIPFDGVEFYIKDNAAYVKSADLPEDIELADMLDINDDASFKLIGRNSEVIKIAGKRGHIGDLNSKLVSIKGVQAGVFYLPAENDVNMMSRLTAFIVAPERRTEDILAELANKIDPVFMPRPLYKVGALPFTSTGKLPQAELKKLYKACKKNSP